MKEQEREAAGVRTSEKRKTREGEIHGVSGKLIESKSSRANLPGTLPNRSPFAAAPGLFPRSIPATMLVSSYHVRNMERNFPDLFFVAGRVRVCRTFTLNGRENGLTARCDCVDEFFCRSNIASRWHAGSTPQRFWGDNASGRCRFWTVRGPEISAETCPFRWPGNRRFVHSALVYIQAPALNAREFSPGRLSEILKSITNA